MRDDIFRAPPYLILILIHGSALYHDVFLGWGDDMNHSDRSLGSTIALCVVMSALLWWAWRNSRYAGRNLVSTVLVADIAIHLVVGRTDLLSTINWHDLVVDFVWLAGTLMLWLGPIRGSRTR